MKFRRDIEFSPNKGQEEISRVVILKGHAGRVCSHRQKSRNKGVKTRACMVELGMLPGLVWWSLGHMRERD